MKILFVLLTLCVTTFGLQLEEEHHLKKDKEAKKGKDIEAKFEKF